MPGKTAFFPETNILFPHYRAQITPILYISLYHAEGQAVFEERSIKHRFIDEHAACVLFGRHKVSISTTANAPYLYNLQPEVEGKAQQDNIFAEIDHPDTAAFLSGI